MRKLVSKIVMTNTKDGHNKTWCGELYDNGVVITRWGPIGGWEKRKIFKKGKEAEPFLIGKIIEKEKKDYETISAERFN
jgi:predicted DNA-binding WGR domain protein